MTHFRALWPHRELAKTQDHSYTLHLTSYILHLTGRSRILLDRAFFARHYSLPPGQPAQQPFPFLFQTLANGRKTAKSGKILTPSLLLPNFLAQPRRAPSLARFSFACSISAPPAKGKESAATQAIASPAERLRSAGSLATRLRALLEPAINTLWLSPQQRECYSAGQAQKTIVENSSFDLFLICFRGVFNDKFKKIMFLYLKFGLESENTFF